MYCLEEINWVPDLRELACGCNCKHFTITIVVELAFCRMRPCKLWLVQLAGKFIVISSTLAINELLLFFVDVYDVIVLVKLVYPDS